MLPAWQKSFIRSSDILKGKIKMDVPWKALQFKVTMNGNFFIHFVCVNNETKTQGGKSFEGQG